MNHWWRAYNEAVNDPKLQLLSDALFRAWFNVMCIASSNDGNLPALKDIAFILRIQPTKAAQVLAQLHTAGLLDKTETGFIPHNWNGRQYKSDVSTDRVKRFRERKGNVSSAVSETPPETEDRNREQKEPEAIASGAEAPLDPSEPEREFFKRGRIVLGNSAGGQLAKLLSVCGRNVSLARSKLELAATKDNAGAFVAGIIRAGPVSTAKPLTAHQQERETGREILNALRDASSRTNSEFQRHDTGYGPASLRGGVRGALVDLSATRDREGHEPVERASRDGQLSELGKVSGSS